MPRRKMVGSITGKDIEILEEASLVFLKIRQLGIFLDNFDYIDSGVSGRSVIFSTLANLQQDAEKAGLKGSLSDVLDKKPLSFEV